VRSVRSDTGERWWLSTLTRPFFLKRRDFVRKYFVAMAEARKAFRLATFGREEQELINDISNQENQLQTALNADRRKELQSALEIARVKMEIAGYKIEYENATTVEQKRRVSDLINKARDTLNELLQKHSSGT
jgi:LmbE family N-acetylglucosaminyl deacetylase